MVSDDNYKTPMPKRPNSKRVVESEESRSEEDDFETPKALKRAGTVSGDEINF
jgi:hypothetical protein